MRAKLQKNGFKIQGVFGWRLGMPRRGYGGVESLALMTCMLLGDYSGAVTIGISQTLAECAAWSCG
jgi:hypothetical protein